MKKLTFIMNDSESFLRDKVLSVAEEWGFTPSDIRHTEVWNAAQASSPLSLFGTAKMTHLDLTDKKKLKAFVNAIDNSKKTGDFNNENWFGVGLIITTLHAQGVKKIENLIKANGGTTIKKEKPDAMRKKLLDEVSLSKRTREQVEDYVGNDYEMLISPLNEIKKLDKTAQQELSFEDFVVMLPTRPGAIPPWEFVTPMLEGRINEAIDLYDRILSGSHVLQTMWHAKSKVDMMYRLKMLTVNGVKGTKKQAEVLGERDSPVLYYTGKPAQRLSAEVVEYIAALTYKVEEDIKGGLNVNSDLHFRSYIAKVAVAAKLNKIV